MNVSTTEFFDRVALNAAIEERRLLFSIPAAIGTLVISIGWAIFHAQYDFNQFLAMAGSWGVFFSVAIWSLWPAMVETLEPLAKRMDEWEYAADYWISRNIESYPVTYWSALFALGCIDVCVFAFLRTSPGLVALIVLTWVMLVVGLHRAWYDED